MIISYVQRKLTHMTIATTPSDSSFQPDMTNRELFEALRTYIDSRLEAFATKEYLDRRLTAFATKNDLKGFATKDDLQAFATKEDLKVFATKEDLKAFATKDDLRQMEARLTRKLDSHKRIYIQQHLVVRADIGQLHQEITKVNDRLVGVRGALA